MLWPFVTRVHRRLASEKLPPAHLRKTRSNDTGQPGERRRLDFWEISYTNYYWSGAGQPLCCQFQPLEVVPPPTLKLKLLATERRSPHKYKKQEDKKKPQKKTQNDRRQNPSTHHRLCTQTAPPPPCTERIR